MSTMHGLSFKSDWLTVGNEYGGGVNVQSFLAQAELIILSGPPSNVRNYLISGNLFRRYFNVVLSICVPW